MTDMSKIFYSKVHQNGHQTAEDVYEYYCTNINNRLRKMSIKFFV